MKPGLIEERLNDSQHEMGEPNDEQAPFTKYNRQTRRHRSATIRPPPILLSQTLSINDLTVLLKPTDATKLVTDVTS